MKKNEWWHGFTVKKGMLLTLRKMKLTILLICLSILSSFGAGYSQNSDLNLKLKNMSLKAVLAEIENRTDYSFLYKADMINDDQLVDVDVSNASVSEILDILAPKAGFSYKIMDHSIIVLTSVAERPNQTQQIRVTGKVTDSSGNPLPGVSVMIKNTTQGAITDTDGNYFLSTIPPDATLIFSFVGMRTQEIAVVGQTSINVAMQEETVGIEEVVAVGYGTQKKINITGSVAQVSSQELLKAPMTSVTNMLTGKLPGLITTQTSGQPGADQASMVIRGLGTFNDASPLLLVDGVERNFNAIDPNDVESVTILKDAAASAVYGVRAAHGVILVKTKRGSSKGRAQVKYSSSYTFSVNTRFPKFLDGVDYARWHNKARELDGNEGYFSEEEIDKIAHGDPEGKLANTDWLGLLFKDFGGTQQHNLSVLGGDEKVQYFTSGGFMDQEGILPNTDFKRYNLRSNIDMEATKELKLSIDIAGRVEKQDYPGFAIVPNGGFNPITQAIRTYPILPVEYNDLPTAGGGGGSTYSPLAAANKSGFNQNDRSVFESAATLEYQVPFVKGLNLKMFFSFDKDYTEKKNFLTTYNLALYNRATGTYTTVKANGTGTNSLFQSSSSGQALMSRPTVEYARKFGRHEVSGLFLYEYRQTKGKNLQAQRRNFPLTDIPELPFALEDSPNSISGGSTETRSAGYVGRLDYIYDSKYLAEFSCRYDGSYKFHKDYRWGFFPSVSVGWILSEENFFRAAFPQVDKFKIRASYGELGRDNIDAFLYTRFFSLTTEPAYAFGTTPSPTSVLYTTNSVPSYDLTWEKTRTVNLGLEFAGWKGLLSADLDLFYKYTYDILQEVSGLYPPSIADNYASIKNSGSVDVRGFELVLEHRNTIGAFSYGLNGNFTWARNKVLSRTQNENIPSWQNLIGKPIGGVYGLHALGLYQTEEQLINRPTGPGGVQRLGDLMYEDVNGDGKIDWSDMVRIANSHTPEIMFSFSINAGWKGFDLSAQFQGAAACDVIISGVYPNGTMDQTEFARAFYSGNSPYYLVEGSWTPENTNAKYPRLGEVWNGNNGWASDWWVVNGAYLRLKNTQIGYTLPKKWMNKIHTQNLRIYVAGTNLFTIDQLDYLDPEMPSNNNGYYPQQKTYSLGLDLTF